LSVTKVLQGTNPSGMTNVVGTLLQLSRAELEAEGISGAVVRCYFREYDGKDGPSGFVGHQPSEPGSLILFGESGFRPEVLFDWFPGRRGCQ
jgi:hypothetical protein